MDITDIKVHTTVPSLSGADTQNGTVKQSPTLAMIAERYPQEAWIHVFTDESATNAVTNGGSGIRVHFPGGRRATASMAVGKHCSSYHAETESRLSSSLTASPSCRLIKTTSSQTLPKPYSKLQAPGGLYYIGFQPTVEYQEMSKPISLQRTVLEENRVATMSASAKRRLSSKRS